MTLSSSSPCFSSGSSLEDDEDDEDEEDIVSNANWENGLSLEIAAPV
jgi:hypothetical protein